jgi:hypothetical protein
MAKNAPSEIQKTKSFIKAALSAKSVWFRLLFNPIVSIMVNVFFVSVVFLWIRSELGTYGKIAYLISAMVIVVTSFTDSVYDYKK